MRHYEVACATIGGAAFHEAILPGDSSSVEIRLHAAAADNHAPGIARLPVTWIKYVQIAGVNPPKTAVARLKASENPEARTSRGMISAMNGTMAPLQLPNMQDNHSSTTNNRDIEGAVISQDNAG